MFMNGVINPIIYFTFNRSFCEGFKVTMGKCGRCRSSAYAPAHVLRRADGPLATTNGLPRNCNAKQGDRKNGITSVNPLQSNKGTRKQHKTTRRQREANDCPYSSWVKPLELKEGNIAMLTKEHNASSQTFQEILPPFEKELDQEFVKRRMLKPLSGLALSINHVPGRLKNVSG